MGLLHCEVFFFQCGHKIKFDVQSVDCNCNETYRLQLDNAMSKLPKTNIKKNHKKYVVTKEWFLKIKLCGNFNGNFRVNYNIDSDQEAHQSIRDQWAARIAWHETSTKYVWTKLPFNWYYLPLKIRREIPKWQICGLSRGAINQYGDDCCESRQVRQMP